MINKFICNLLLGLLLGLFSSLNIFANEPVETLAMQMPLSEQSAYRLGPGDKLNIKVFGQEELSMAALLGNSGEINYPFLGELRLLGLTTKQVETLISDGLKNGYLIDPNVYVHIEEYRQFYIHGEVKQPGGYPYQAGLTINQAVALAGGLTERASTSKIYLYKENNKNNRINVPMDYPLSPGDTVTIKQRFF